jgi:predicted membrane protein
MKKVFRRFVDIWKLDFLALFFAGEKNNNKTTIFFWIFSSVLLALFASIILFFFLFNTSDEIVDTIEQYVPETAQINLTNGQLTIRNVEQPFLKEIKATAQNNGFDGTIAIAVDVESKTYDDTVLDDYDGGVAVFADHITIKNALQSEEFSFDNLSDFEISRNDLIDTISNKQAFANIVGQFVFGVFIILLLGLLIGRLLLAFWWALLLFVLMRIIEVKEGYMTAYKAVINFYFIPTIVSIILWFFGIHVPMMTTMIFTALFVANLIWLKKQQQKVLTAKGEATIIENETKENTPTKTTKK